MAKAIAPLLSLKARGTIRKVMTFLDRRDSQAVQKFPTHRDAGTAAQLAQRDLFVTGIAHWYTLTDEEKAEYAEKDPLIGANPSYLNFMKAWLLGEVIVAVGEGHITILPLSYDSIGQGTWAITLSTIYWSNATLLNHPPVDLDNISFNVYLDAGTYTLLLYTTTYSDRAIVDVDIDDTEVASFDLYTGALVPNATMKETGIVIATAGLYTLKLRADGKNASSNNYYAGFKYIALWRTA